MADSLQINSERLWQRLQQLGECGALPGGGVSRLALSKDDQAGRDLVVSWMQALGLTVHTDAIGNVVAVLEGKNPQSCVMMGSHIDTVSTAGLFDGNLGVLAGLEVIETIIEQGTLPECSLAVAFFTNEEGSRFAPDMMGSAVFNGSLPLEQALATQGIDGATVSDELAAIGYQGGAQFAPVSEWVKAFIELHIEQGPILDQQGVDIGVVEGVQGISWQQITLKGQSNHAGTTPMAYRHDPAVAAMQCINFAHNLASANEGQLATVGSLELKPNLVNVIPHTASFTLDMRNSNEQQLSGAEREVDQQLQALAEQHQLSYSKTSLARFEPVPFHTGLVSRIEQLSQAQGYSTQRMYSGAGHDCQMFAPHCPSAMIFVPSIAGISHNIEEFTSQPQIEKGANVLLKLVMELSNKDIDYV
ncbi:Zn-dependent hydrolase [Aliagarivorans taiwanensis]|uniref:Zn-dependent hydrolase n=1 Tax=Aliagarivorans taiwanensis TaxID=561966 RepID=UPI00040F8D4E|nr:Zn-dependent hydrolase [Aliagarivorans taiwanensis]